MLLKDLTEQRGGQKSELPLCVHEFFHDETAQD